MNLKRCLLTSLLAAILLAAQSRNPEAALGAARYLEEAKGDYTAAIAAYKKFLADYGKDRVLAAKALVGMAEAYEKLGDAESRKIYAQVVKDYADQKEAVATARARLGGAQVSASAGTASRLLWTLPPKGDIEGTISRDGRYVPYVDWGKCGDLHVHDLVTGADRQITNTGANYCGEGFDQFADTSTFSRGGDQLAYSWYRGDHDRYEMRVVDLSGNSARPGRTTQPGVAAEIPDAAGRAARALEGGGVPQFRLLFDNEDVDWIGPSDWSPDGKWIAVEVERKDKTKQIGLVSVKEGSLRVLKSVDWRGSGKVWFSPDGKYVGYDLPESDVSQQRDVFVMAIDGTVEIPAVVHRGQDLMVGWSPDGKQLLFASDRGGSMGLWGLPFTDGKPQGAPELIREDFGSADLMGMTDSGALYSVYPGALTQSSSLKTASFDFDSGKIISPATNVTQVYLQSIRQPSWSPDGRYLAYIPVRARPDGHPSLTTVLVIRSAETGQVVRELQPKLRYLHVAAWALDGRSFLTHGTDFKGRSGVFTVDSQTGEVSSLRIDQRGEYTAYPAWSPDGKSIYFRLADGKGFFTAFIERDLASGNEKEMIRRSFLGEPSVSPDGKYLATPSVNPSSNSRVMLLIPTAGGEPRELMPVPAEVKPEDLGNYDKGQFVSYPQWAADSRSFLITKTFSDRKQGRETWRVPINGDAPVKLDLRLDSNISGYAFDLSRRRIAYVENEATTSPSKPDEVWVMEHFLPATSASK